MFMIFDLKLSQAKELRRMLNLIAYNNPDPFTSGGAGNKNMSILWDTKTVRIAIQQPIVAYTNSPPLSDDQWSWDPTHRPHPYYEEVVA